MDITAEPKNSRTNWAGNITYSAERLLVPDSVAEAQEMVRAADKLRVLGSRHCFNDIADTPGSQLSLERLRQVVSLDRAKSRVTVEGGTRYGDLGPWLHAQGYALHNLASLPHISIPGACATGTHGSGTALGNLATAIAAIEFIDAEGEIVSLSRESDGDTFAGAVVNLGALGVVTRLTLDVQPDFIVRQDVYRELPADAVEAHFDEIMASGYSVSLFTDWQGDTVEQAWIKSVVEPGRDFATRPSFFDGWPATETMHPIAGLDASHCTEQMGIPGPAYDRIAHFRIGSTPASGEDLQAEYFVPREHAVAAVKALRRLGDGFAPLLMVGEIRTVAADDLWLSPCYRRASAVFHFSFNHDPDGVMGFLPELEAALAPFRPRPHWGKLFAMSPTALADRYEKLPSFRALIETHDPAGKFRNRYIERNIFGRT